MKKTYYAVFDKKGNPDEHAEGLMLYRTKKDASDWHCVEAFGGEIKKVKLVEVK